MPPTLGTSIEAPPASIAAPSAARKVRRHVIISGTGRAGTTFLVELLTHLGLDTGFTPDQLGARKDGRAHTGLEHDVRRDDAPYIVKSPCFCDTADDVLARRDISIDHVLVPMRDLHAAAESRRLVGDAALAECSLLQRLRRSIHPRRVRGGLWHTAKGHEQELILVQQLYRLMLALSAKSVPLTLLKFPRLVKDPAYLFEKLQPILPNVSSEQFDLAFELTARPDLIHQFNANDR